MWKHKTKWLVRGGRKVKCYLCGKKILSKGDPFLFHQDTGYYSHQSCQAESTTISGNERRKAVKKIAVGAAVVGAIAAGAGKFLDVSSQSKNSPAAQTILTSQGLIPPALTSDPANPVPGQMWYRSDAGVMAHFDGVQNRVVYSSEINDGNVNVTSKGIVNGLSVLPNDGKGGFGPDTTKGATAPGQYGSPYTETVGIKESIAYANTLIQSGSLLPEIVLGFGTFSLSNSINLPSYIHIRGSGMNSTYLVNYGEVFTISSNTVAIQLSDMVVQSYTAVAGDFSQTEISSSFVFENLDFITNADVNALVMDGNEDGWLNNIHTSNNQGNGSTVPSFSYKIVSGSTAIGKLATINGAIIQAINMSIIYRTIGGCLTIVNNPDYPSSFTLLSGNDEPSAATTPVATSAIAFVQSGSSTQPVNISIGGYAGTLGSTITEVIDNPAAFPVYIDFIGYWAYNGQSSSIPLINDYSDVTLLNLSNLHLTNTTIPSASISTNPPVSGTTYQNTNPYDIRLKIPMTYSPTSTAAATLATGISSTSTVTTSTKVSIPAGVTTGEILTYDIVVPQGWYFELVATNATIGTVEVEVA